LNGKIPSVGALYVHWLVRNKQLLIYLQSPSPQIKPIKPLDLANARKAAKPKAQIVPPVDSDQEHDWPDNLTDKGFMAFLRRELKGPTNGFPETLMTIDKRKERYNTYNNTVDWCAENWKNIIKGSPYRVPESEICMIFAWHQ
jgi:hypothetical protein